MKIVFVTVSAPALKLLPTAAAQLNKAASAPIELKIYYATTEFTQEKRAIVIREITDADATFLDMMGAPPANIDAVNEGCAASKGQIIPYGASPREYMRLGAFTSASMQRNKSHSDQNALEKPSPEAMKKMADMAQVMGKVLPGKMRDMRNYALLSSYFQNACLENMTRLVNLLASDYGHIKGLPKLKPPIEPLPAALFDLDAMITYTKPSAFFHAMGYHTDKPNVALHFNIAAYPTDTLPCVRAIAEKISPFCNVFPIGTSGFFSEYKTALEKFLLQTDYPMDLYLDCTPFRLGAGPMGGDAQAGVALLKKLGVPYLHPMFMTRRTEKEWQDSPSGCSPNEVLLSYMLPEMDGAMEIMPVAAMGEMIHADENEYCELEVLEERLDRLTQRIKRHLYLRRCSNKEKRIAIICYNYPPGEANLFGGAFLDTFASVSHILHRLKQEGYTTNALSPEELMQIFTMGKAVNSGKYDTNWDEQILWDGKNYHAAPEISQVWGSAPGQIMTEGNAFIIPGTVQGNVFIGLQPARGNDPDSAETYHDKSVPPHHQYAAFYQWLRNEFQADAMIHVGTHGTLEFLKGKECGMSESCWPDRLIADIPHIYLYYCGNPSEAIIAKRRSLANLISYQPPVFVTGGLYGQWLELSTQIDDYHHLLSVSPNSAADAKKGLLEKAASMGLSTDLDEIEAELYRMNHSLIPKGLHVFGQPYSDEELHQYALGIAALRAGGEELDSKTLQQAQADAQKARDNHEMDGLMEALAGRFNPPKLAGDIFRSPEVMPTGYNLYQFDSRQIPSATALRRGWEIAEKTLQTYLLENHGYPQSVAVIAWGLETSRTQGETIGQILAYLGVRQANNTSLWDHKYELVPLEELGRPRIDVTVNICGFFRDMFPNTMEELDDIFHMVYHAQESAEQNFFRAHSLQRYEGLLAAGHTPADAEELAVARLFGPKEGEYGTGLTGIVEQKNWQNEEELGANFTDSLHYIYTRHSTGRKEKELYEENLRCVDVISQLRANTEYEITDLDHYYEFFGGLAKSVEMVKGKKSAMYITDVTGGQIHTETADKSIARGLRTRVLNPKWIDGMLEHPYHGAQKIADRFENVMGLAATTGAVDKHFYDDLESCYVKDEERKRQMAMNNPHAYLRILEQMLEYHSRGYWDATTEQLDRIKNAYLEIEGQIESNQ